MRRKRPPENWQRPRQHRAATEPVATLTAALTGQHADHPFRFLPGRCRLEGFLRTAGPECLFVTATGCGLCGSAAGSRSLVQNPRGNFDAMLNRPGQFLFPREAATVIPAFVGTHTATGTVGTRKGTTAIFDHLLRQRQPNAGHAVAGQYQHNTRYTRAPSGHAPSPAMQRPQIQSRHAVQGCSHIRNCREFTPQIVAARCRIIQLIDGRPGAERFRDCDASLSAKPRFAFGRPRYRSRIR